MEPTPSILEPLLEPFIEGAPQARKVRALLDAGSEFSSARAAAVWVLGPEGSWHCLAARGEDALLPTPSQVEAVAAGVLDANLPLSRTVVAPAADWCLALGGLEPGVTPDLDLLEAFLVAVAFMDPSAVTAEIPQPKAPIPTRGTHGPGSALHAEDLRDLLSNIRDLESRLESPTLAPAERMILLERLDQACIEVGDLLLDEGRGEAA